MEGHVLKANEPPELSGTHVGAAEDAPPAPEDVALVPSVMSVVTNYMIGGAEVSPPAPDGSRMVKLQAAGGVSMVECALSKELCEFLADKLVSVDIIEQGDEDAGSGE